MSTTTSIQFAAASYFAAEPESGSPGQIAITLVRSGNLDLFSDVALNVTPLTAQLDDVFLSSLPDFVSFEPGEATKTIVVDVQPDMEIEGLETLEFALINPDPNTEIGDQGTTTLHILDYQTSYVEFAQGQYTLYEPESGETQLAVTLTRRGNLDAPAAVQIEATGGTATDTNLAIQYPNFADEVWFAPGQVSQTVILTVDADPDPEALETLQLSLLSTDSDTEVGPQSTATVQIQDNSSAGPVVEFAQARYVTREGETPDAIAITLVRRGDVEFSSEVELQALGGTAAQGQDYEIWQGQTMPLDLPRSIRFRPGETSKTIYLDAWSDGMAEGTEQVAFAVTSQDSRTTIGANSSTVVDIQDAQLTYVAFAQDRYTVYEGPNWNSLALTLVRTGDRSTSVTVDLVPMGGTATWDQDFYPLMPDSITFAAGETTKTILLDVYPDGFMGEGTEFFEFGLAKSEEPGNASLVIGEQSRTTVRIVEPDVHSQSVVAFEQTSYTLSEGEDPYAVAVTLTRTGNMTQPAQVQILLNGGTAQFSPSTFDTDYNILVDEHGVWRELFAPDGFIDFAPHEISKTLLVVAQPDFAFEGTEFVNLQVISEDPQTQIGDQSVATVKILDEETPYVSFAESSYTVYEEGDRPTQIALTLTRSGDPNSFARVEVVPVGGSAEWSFYSGTGDFFLEPLGGYGTVDGPLAVEFNPGEVTKTLLLTVNPDGDWEGTETFQFALQGIDETQVGPQATADIRILEGESFSTPTFQRSTIEFEQTKYIAVEGEDPGAIAVTLTRTGNLNDAAYVELLLNGGTAENGLDYRVHNPNTDSQSPQEFPGMVRFEPGQRTQTLLIEVLSDEHLGNFYQGAEGTEFFTVELFSYDDWVTIGEHGATTVEIWDAQQTYVEFAESRVTAAESTDFQGNSSIVELVLTRRGDLNQEARVDLLPMGGTAKLYEDLQLSLPVPVDFAPGEQTRTVQVEVLADGRFEPTESFQFGLAGLGHTNIGPQSTTTLMIQDGSQEDGEQIQFTATNYVAAPNLIPYSSPSSDPALSDNWVEITLERTGNLNAYSEVLLLLNGGTAQYWEDYELVHYENGMFEPFSPGQPIAFDPGESSQTIWVDVGPVSNQPEDREFVTFEIVNSQGDRDIIGDRSQTTLEILGDLSSPLFSLMLPPQMTEGEEISLDIQNTSYEQGIIYTIDWGDGSPVTTIGSADDGFNPPAPGEIYGVNHVYANDGSYTLKVTATDDDGEVVERTRQMVVEAMPPVITLSVTDGEAAEGWPANNGQVMLIVDNPHPTHPVSVSLQVTDASGAIATDINLFGSNVTFDRTTGMATVVLEPGVTEARVNLMAIDDTEAEASEVINLTLLPTPDYGIGTVASGDITILESDPLPADETTGGGQGDTLDGTSGDDRLEGGGGDDTLNGLGGDDLLLGQSGNDLLNGGTGDDDLRSGGGDDTLNGGAGLDKLNGGGSLDILNGGADNDLLLGGADDDILNGDEGNDVLNGGMGADAMAGGTGDDVYVLDDAGDMVSEAAGAGNDWVKSAAFATLDLSAFMNVENAQLLGLDNLDAVGDGNDNELRGNKGANLLSGLAGDDVLKGGDGDDQLMGDEGSDRLVGGDGNDLLMGGTGDDRVIGHDGDDQLTGGVGSDRLIGGDGNDLLLGVDVDASEPGLNDKDVLKGGLGADIFVLGDESKDYYVGGRNVDRAIIPDFNALEGDTIRLSGQASNYTLSEQINKEGQLVGQKLLSGDDLIAIVRGEAIDSLTLSSPAFEYLATTAL